MSIELKSAAFEAGGTIPDRHAKQGDDVFPPLQWSPVPAVARELAVLVRTPDAPSGRFVHWVVSGLPADINRLEAAGAAAQEAVRLLVSLRAWPDLVAALVNLAVLQPDPAVSLLAQACWLTARVGIGPEYALRPALALVEALGPSHPSSLESSAYALALASAATRDPEKDSRLASSWTATARCLRARRVDPDRWHEFLRSDGLVDVDDVRQRLLASLPALVPPHAWVFERSELQRRRVRDCRQS